MTTPIYALMGFVFWTVFLVLAIGGVRVLQVVRGETAVYSGILLGADGTPVAPGGVTVMASTNGRLTVGVIVIVGEPDSDLGGDTLQHVVRDAVDDIVKSFDWGSAP